MTVGWGEKIKQLIAKIFKKEQDAGFIYHAN
jgi:hypothetical protein